MPGFPSGTVTFLFTDIEGSTSLWEQHPEAMRVALARHDALLRQTIGQHEGVVFKTVGDAFCAAFAVASQALSAALVAQNALQADDWQPTLALRVRMALHTGAAELRDNDYFGPPLNRIARLLAAGHGAQVLLSLPTEELVRDTLPARTHLQNLGEHRLRDLDRPETVFQLLHPKLLAEFPPLKSLNNPALPNNLPVQLTSFIGREKEIAEVKALLTRTRLLTLTGSGGAGKTRLSLQAAAEVLEEYPDGVWLVELASIGDPALVPQALATALGLTEQTGKSFTQRVTEHLKPKRTLLLLDNCEHLLSACARLTDALLRSCPGMKILASSREGLGIAGEQTYRIPSLSLPDPRQTPTVESIGPFEAVQLFVERALLNQAAFAVTNLNAPALASVCHRLDGIPLAIELAAARVRSLSVEEINTRLDNRFRLLTGGSKTALPRQQTLAAAIGWSYDLLNAQERRLLARLAVFLGGWTLDAAEAVGVGEELEGWEVFDLLTGLVDKSLVQAETGAEQARYRLLETVRQYALELLVQSGESQSVRERHRDYFVRRAEEVRPQLIGAEQAQILRMLDAEHDNLRQALMFCREESERQGGSRAGLRLGTALQKFWQTRGHYSEGCEFLTAVLAPFAEQEPDRTYADALNGAGILTWLQNDYPAARALHAQSLAIRRQLGDKEGIADSLSNLGNVARTQGDLTVARSLTEESLMIARELEDPSRIGNAVNNLGIIDLLRGDYASGRLLLEESLTLWRGLGNRAAVAQILLNLGGLAFLQGDYPTARALFSESLAMKREIGEPQGIATALANLGDVVLEQGDYVLARSLCEEGLRIRRTLGDRSGIFQALGKLGLIACEHGDYALANSLQEESLTIAQELGDKVGISHVLLDLGLTASRQKDYGTARSRYEEGFLLKRELGDRAGIARALGSLGYVACREGNYPAALALFKESLTLRRELGKQQSIAHSLEEFASLAAHAGNAERAVRLWGTYEALRETLHFRVPSEEKKRMEDEKAVVRKTFGEDAFAAAWTEGRALTLEEAVAYALEETA